MNHSMKLVTLSLGLMLGMSSQAVSFGLIQEMLNNGSLSQKDYEFKRDDASQIADVDALRKQIEAVNNFQGKANGMRFSYRGTTNKPIKRLFKIDRKICNYATEKYFSSLGDFEIEPSALNTLDEKDLYRLRFKRCMQSEGWVEVRQ